MQVEDPKWNPDAENARREDRMIEVKRCKDMEQNDEPSGSQFCIQFSSQETLMQDGM